MVHFDNRGFIFTPDGAAGRLDLKTVPENLFPSIALLWKKHIKHGAIAHNEHDPFAQTENWFRIYPKGNDQWVGGLWSNRGEFDKSFSFEADTPLIDFDPLADLRRGCKGLILLEKNALPPFAEMILSQNEEMLFHSMSAKRRLDFLAGRIALKLLARKMTSPDNWISPKEMETICPDSDLPNFQSVGHGSLAHNERFAIAIAGDYPCGVDVEKADPRMVEGLPRYTAKHERAALKGLPMDEMLATARIWTGKEAVAKAYGKSMFWAWKHCRFLSIGQDGSEVFIDGKTYQVSHSTIDRHVFSAVHLV